MADHEDLRRLALGLPETTEDPHGRRFFVRGKQFCWPWMERIDPRRARVANASVIAVRVANELEKQSLLALDPAIFFTEPHYDGYPAVLVRLPRISVDLLDQVLTDAWRAKAPRSLIRALDAAEGRR
jgi:hypothetical protein